MSLDDTFPRAMALPKQSPLFWVTHKDRYLRQLLISDIESKTKRDLLVYFTDVDNTDAQIDPGDDQFLMELLKGKKYDGIDLLLETAGGMTDATEKICSLLRQMAPDLRVVVPRKAKSNGTVIALTGRSVLMAPSSELGPIDPAVLNIPAEYILKDQDAYNATLYRVAESASQQTKKLAKNLLSTGMLKGKSSEELDAVVQKLASRDCYASHGSVIDVREALDLGLNVEVFQPDDELWGQFWLLRTMCAYDCPRNGHAKLFESATISTSVVVKISASMSS